MNRLKKRLLVLTATQGHPDSQGPHPRSSIMDDRAPVSPWAGLKAAMLRGPLQRRNVVIVLQRTNRVEDCRGRAHPVENEHEPR